MTDGMPKQDGTKYSKAGCRWSEEERGDGREGRWEKKGGGNRGRGVIFMLAHHPTITRSMCVHVCMCACVCVCVCVRACVCLPL